MFSLPRPSAPAVEGPPACARCGATLRLLCGDGRVVCWPCLLAWGAFARLATAGPIKVEPGMVSSCRLGHRRPRVGCPWCLGRRDDRSAGIGMPDVGGQRGPTA
jgi:hypothetical protein